MSLLWPYLLLLIILLYLVEINKYQSDAPKDYSRVSVGVVGWGGVHSTFNVQPNYSVEVVLCCVIIGVVTRKG